MHSVGQLGAYLCLGESHLWAAGAALRHSALPGTAIMPWRSLRKVVGNLRPAPGRKRLPHILRVLLAGSITCCPHACAKDLHI